MKYVHPNLSEPHDDGISIKAWVSWCIHMVVWVAHTPVVADILSHLWTVWCGDHNNCSGRLGGAFCGGNGISITSRQAVVCLPIVRLAHCRSVHVSAGYLGLACSLDMPPASSSEDISQSPYSAAVCLS